MADKKRRIENIERTLEAARPPERKPLKIFTVHDDDVTAEDGPDVFIIHVVDTGHRPAIEDPVAASTVTVAALSHADDGNGTGELTLIDLEAQAEALERERDRLLKAKGK